jgi:hypothetical protein
MTRAQHLPPQKSQPDSFSSGSGSSLYAFDDDFDQQ